VAHDLPLLAHLDLVHSAGAAAAIAAAYGAGVVSDAWRSRCGRRPRLILWGRLYDLLFQAMLAIASGLPGSMLGDLGL
jgi:hypothetical protein